MLAVRYTERSQFCVTASNDILSTDYIKSLLYLFSMTHCRKNWIFLHSFVKNFVSSVISAHPCQIRLRNYVYDVKFHVAMQS